MSPEVIYLHGCHMLFNAFSRMQWRSHIHCLLRSSHPCSLLRLPRVWCDMAGLTRTKCFLILLFGVFTPRWYPQNYSFEWSDSPSDWSFNFCLFVFDDHISPPNLLFRIGFLKCKRDTFQNLQLLSKIYFCYIIFTFLN